MHRKQINRYYIKSCLMHHYDTLISLKTLFLNPLKLNLIQENVYIQTSLERRVEVAVVVLYVN